VLLLGEKATANALSGAAVILIGTGLVIASGAKRAK